MGNWKTGNIWGNNGYKVEFYSSDEKIPTDSQKALWILSKINKRNPPQMYHCKIQNTQTRKVLKEVRERNEKLISKKDEWQLYWKVTY